MLKKYATFLLILHLMASTPLGEIVRLPFLIHHGFVHFQEDGEMDIVHFFKLHYFSGNLLDDDFHKDMQLPFKSLQVTAYTTIGHIPDLIIFRQEITTPVVRRSISSVMDAFLPSTFHALIWQPPRLV